MHNGHLWIVRRI